MIAWVGLLGCGDVPVELPELEVRAEVTDVGPAGGLLTVTTVHGPERVQLPGAPVVDGLRFRPEGEPREERVGDRIVVTQRWRFSGDEGSYEIPALVVRSGEQQARSAPVWVDLGVEPPKVGELADIVEPAPVWEIPWGTIACVALGSGAAVAMIGLAFGWAVRPRPSREEPLPPDVRWLRAWELAREDPTLTDEDRARELSRIFRAYTEEVLGFSAVSWTTSEILAHLEGMEHLPAENLPRARRLLRATDLVKYAEQRPEGAFFDDLDADLRAFVASTRPARLEPVEEDGG